MHVIVGTETATGRTFIVDVNGRQILTHEEAVKELPTFRQAFPDTDYRICRLASPLSQRRTT